MLTKWSFCFSQYKEDGLQFVKVTLLVLGTGLSACHNRGKKAPIQLVSFPFGTQPPVSTKDRLQSIS